MKALSDDLQGTENRESGSAAYTEPDFVGRMRKAGEVRSGGPSVGLASTQQQGGTGMRYEVVLRYGVNPKGHEYVFARVRRENGAEAERDSMVTMTIENMLEHCHGGRVVQGSLADDPNAVVVAAVHPDGRTVYKVVTYRPAVRPEDDRLGDALVASLVALNGASR